MKLSQRVLLDFYSVIMSNSEQVKNRIDNIRANLSSVMESVRDWMVQDTTGNSTTTIRQNRVLKF